MANENVVFRRGPSSSIPEQKVPGTILIETDTGNAFVDDTAENRVQLTDTRLTTRVDDVISQYGYIHNGVLTGDLNASSHSINNLPTPSANGDAANKQYVDTAFTTLESELGTTIAGYLPLKNGVISHANIYKHPKLPSAPYKEIEYPKGVIRSFRLDRLVEELEGNELGVEDIKRIMSDHVNYPSSICRHGDDTVTVFSSINDLNKLEMHLSVGNPCEGYYFVKPFEEVK